MKDLAETLRAEVGRAAAQLRRLTDADVTRDRGAGQWVKKEILGHLIDSAANNDQRFVRAALADTYIGPDYAQQPWVRAHRYRDRHWPELVDTWEALNRQVAAAIASIPETKRQVPCTIGNDQPATLQFVAEDYLVHMKHHLAQLLA